MADEKISQLPSTNTFGDSDQVPILQGGTNYRISGSHIKQQIGAKIDATPPLYFDDPTSTASITKADAKTDGYLSSVDWNRFNASLTTGNLTESTSHVLTIAGGVGAVIGIGTTITVQSATTSVPGVTQLSNSYAGTSQVLAVTEKALKDGLDSVTPGAAIWEADGTDTYIYPATNWEIYAEKNYRLNNTSLGSILDIAILPNGPLGSTYPAQNILSNAYFDQTAGNYIFKANLVSNTITGYATLTSMGNAYHYSCYEAGTVDKTITPSTLYTTTMQVPAGATFVALFDSKLDADYSIGSGTATVINASLMANKLDLLDSAPRKYVEFSATGNADFAQNGTIRFSFIPNFNTFSPHGTSTFFAIYDIPSGTKKNLIECKCVPNGINSLIYLEMRDQGNAVVFANAFAGIDFVFGKLYEIELDFNITLGEIRCFVDGTQLGSTKSCTATRTATCNKIDIGIDFDLSTENVNGYILDFVVFNTTQHTANYTIGYESYKYFYLKQKYTASTGRYQFNYGIDSNFIRLGEAVNKYGVNSSESTYAISAGKIARASKASTYLGFAAPIITINGQYNSLTDQITFRSNGTNAFGSIITHRGWGAYPDPFAIYIYSGTHATDYSASLETLTVGANRALSIDFLGNLYYKASINSLWSYATPMPGTTGAPAAIVAKYNTIRTFEKNVHDTVILPKAYAGMEIFIDLNFGNPGDWFNVECHAGDTIHDTDIIFQHSARMQRLTYSADKDGNWVVKTQNIIDHENSLDLPQLPNNSTFYATYQNSINGTAGYGSLTGTAYNAAAVVNGRLDCSGAALKRIEYVATGIADFVNVGAVKFKLTPNYSGHTGAYREIFSVAKATGEWNKNLIVLSHSPADNLNIYITGPSGSILLDSNFGAWSPVSGTTYEFELDIDLVTPAIRLFIDGVQVGSTLTSTGTRDSTIGMLAVGGHTYASDFFFEDFVVYNYPQHTANYTPGYTLNQYKVEVTNTTSTINDLRISEDLLVYGTSTLGDVIVEGAAVQNSYHAPTTDAEFSPKKYVDDSVAGVGAIITSTTGITAYATGGQANATSAPSRYNFISVCATGGDSVKLPAATLNLVCTIRNNGAASSDCFPQVGEYMDGVQNAASAIANGTSATFVATSAAHWVRI
jgi:hypothetical protein